MNILLSFFFLLIASIIGISICLVLNMKSYLKIAIVVMCIFIPIEIFNDYFHKNNNLKNKIPINNSQPNTISNTNVSEQTKYSSVDTTQFQMTDKPPFDGLEPKELLLRLNYLYYATANPLKPINYLNYKTHADKL